MGDEEIAMLSERASATIGDPAPVGLWGFATGTWIVGTVIANAFPQSALTATIPVLVVFAGLVQFIAGLYAFRRTNMLASTAFCCFGAFNATAGFFFALQAANSISTGGAPMVLFGFLLESFAFISLTLAVAATKSNWALVAVLGTLAIGYCLSGIPDLANASGVSGWAIVKEIGGWFLVASAFFAYYTGAALVINSSWRRTLLPIGGEP
jgi:succinate-acetate transporter protein